jgi:hypothetical protein
MSICLCLAACATALVAAARSTWSPCGLSMLASITPLSEAGRGHRYRATATWFVAGSAVGGVALGLVVAPFALGFAALSLTSAQVSIVVFAVATATAISDIGLKGFRLPVHHRQVNERWLDQFRPWVYGAGFGWQIGTGLATYIVTAAVYLMMVLTALTGQVLLVVGVGSLFGLVRGLSVCLGRHITDSDSLRTFHHRFQLLGPKIRGVTIGVQLLVIAVFGWILSPWLALAMAAVSCACGIVQRHRRPSKSPQAVAQPS